MDEQMCSTSKSTEETRHGGILSVWRLESDLPSLMGNITVEKLGITGE